MLMEQLVKDQEAVDQVRQIVQKEENVMKQETQMVENYAKVSAANYSSHIFNRPKPLLLT